MMFYDLQQGVLTTGGWSGPRTSRPNQLRFRRLESRLTGSDAYEWSSAIFDFEVAEFTTDPSQDLVAVLELKLWVTRIPSLLHSDHTRHNL